MMNYPLINNWLVFKRLNEYEVEAKDCLCDDEYILGWDIACFARKLNGKRNPYTIDSRYSRAEVDHMLNALREHDLLRENNVLMKEFGSIFYTLWIPKYSRKLRIFASLYSVALDFLWLPVFCLGAWLYCQSFPFGGEDFYLFGSLGGLIAGAFLHELGHMFTGFRYGARVFEMGVMVQHFMPGAYVLLESDKVKSKKGRVAINAAGVKSNVLFAGICLLLACVLPGLGMPLLLAAINNVLLALINVIFIAGLDGTSIIEEYLGVRNIAAVGKTILFSKNRRRSLLSKGLTGYAVMAVGMVVQFLQLALPLLIGINLLEVISCFV